MKKWLLFLVIVLIVSKVNATHQRSGEITYTHVSGLTYDFTIVTYTFAPSPADRPELEIKWGDGTSDILSRTNGPPGYTPANIWVDHVGEIVGPNIRKNIYTGRKTFPGSATYIISLEDPNRNLGVINIPNSVDVPFYVQTILVINPLMGSNSSPQLLLPPIDNGCVGYPFLHNTGAYDPDGDSISYKLVSCKGAEGLDIPGYTLPQATNSITINPVTGDLVWDSPTIQGEFNLAILVEEWRKIPNQSQWIRIGSVTRDLQVIVGSCENNPNPPVIQSLANFCVTANDTLSFDVIATDADNDLITLTATGQPMLLQNSPATFPQPADSASHITGTFTWPTVCDHVSKEPYKMFFKAQDNGTPVRLVDIKSVNILVIGPAPENLSVSPLGNRIQLIWSKYICENASGFKVYRKTGPSAFMPGNCITGVPASSGFQLIAQLPAINDTTYDDFGGTPGLIHGLQYCYLVSAIFSDGAESYASNQACTSLKRDVPVITNASVESTSNGNGVNFVAWSKPTELDYSQTPGPFIYIIRRSSDLQPGFQVIDSLPGLDDTIYFDQNLNTVAGGYSYIIDLINDTPCNRFLIGSSQQAATMFLQIAPDDEQLILSWNVQVPWLNEQYIIYRLNRETMLYDSVGFSTTQGFTDSSLINDSTYCYKVMSYGNYLDNGFVTPIINYSQEKCARPEDLTPPCPPFLWVATNCDLFENNLTWTNTNHYCPSTLDTEKYYIWYRPSSAGDYVLLDSTMTATDTIFSHKVSNSIAGCYAITALDTYNNMSDFSNEECVTSDACPLYTLPNVFTPNGDSYNDLWIPFPYNGVDRVELQVFNRWGKLVFETTDPDVEWDGRNQQTNQPCPDGVYFYTCNIYEATLEGIRKRTISGAVHIIK